MVRLAKAALFPEINTDIRTGCSPSSACLPKSNTHFRWSYADKAMSFSWWACHSRDRSWRTGCLSRSPLPAASRAACSTQRSWCSDSSKSSVTLSTAARGNKLISLWGSGAQILQSYLKKTRRPNYSCELPSQIQLWSLVHKCKAVPRFPCKMRVL